jgi:hypothetical protein
VFVGARLRGRNRAGAGVTAAQLERLDELYELYVIWDSDNSEDRPADSTGVRWRFLLSEHATPDEAIAAGQLYLRDHPGSWLQWSKPGGAGQDVVPLEILEAPGTAE